ncbi:MAG: vancomycin resistance histidine kinase VanS [Clostridia bacterium]|nr:vancomycin resistance histidine kinase VanS [Clostridia bacterium]
MNNKDFIRLKTTIAIKAVLKIIAYSLFSIWLLSILVDGLFNDILANSVSEYSRSFYLFCVSKKDFLISIAYFIVIAIVSFFVVRNLNNNIIEVISAMDNILKKPEEDIKLSSELAIIESKLNKLRIDLITSKKAADDANKKKDDLIMYMAHDLKTPLTSVIGYLTLLTEEKEISYPLKEKYMKIALDKSLRLEELTNQFFEITKYNLHDMPISKQNIDLSFLIGQVLDEFYPMLQERNLKYSVNTPEHLYMLGDGDKLARAFGNLVRNAIYYSYEGTDIVIDLLEKEGRIYAIFKNKGDKIPDYKLDKIFDKFYRIDSSRATDTGGTGLGLAITKEIIELHRW